MSQLGGRNVDAEVVAGFGDEWTRFDQIELAVTDLTSLFESYFRIFPWSELPPNAEGIDVGCGSGRWARLVAPRVGLLHCVDGSSEALEVARRATVELNNVRFHHATVSDIPVPDNSLDFGYSLGVLHHVPDTQAGINACVAKLKPGAPLLLYLYYALDDRPWWFRAAWKASDVVRRRVSRMPNTTRYIASQILATTVYFPLARLSLVLESIGFSVDSIPLSAYRDKSFYTMRTDALDRFGTRLEQRFTRAEITSMMERAGLSDIRFSDAVPYWCAIGYKVQ